MMGDLIERAIVAMQHADDLWAAGSRTSDLAAAREVEADAWEEAGAIDAAQIARRQASQARLGNHLPVLRRSTQAKNGESK